MQWILICSILIHWCLIMTVGQNDGKYRPPTISPIPKLKIIDGRYNPNNDGRYKPVNDGRYVPDNNGRYRGVNDGRYIHVGDKDRGLYSGGGGQYDGGFGQYTGDGGQYNGGFGPYSGNNGNANFGSSNSNIGGYDDSEKNAKVSVTTTTTKAPTTKKVSTTERPKTTNKLALGNGNNGWNIIRDEKSEQIDGYHYLYETENGILAEESGRIEVLAPSEEGLRSKGFYEYTGDDGNLYRVDYVADNNGFVPQGDHIPKVPIEIQRLLDYLAKQN